MRMVLLAAAGGAIGAAGRYLTGLWALRYFGFGFPWGTLIVNVVGSFLMGLLVAYILWRGAESDALRVFLATGVLGGFTTFSAFALDFTVLMERRELASALAYLFANVGLSLAAIFAGLAMMRQLLQ